MKNTIQDMMEFLGASASAFHAIEQIVHKLRNAGFERLQEGGKWLVRAGGKYFVTRNQSSVIAFAIPECGFAPVQIVASHSDSPVFKLKKYAEVEALGHYVQLNVEKYGGMLMNTWLDRPLSVAGRAIVREGNRLEARLVNVDRDLVLIPNLAIHMNRDLAEGGKYNAQVDMMPLVGSADAKGALESIIAETAGAAPEAVVGSDLYLYNRMQPSVWGANREYISAPRLDDLECAYTSTEAFLAAEPANHINMLCVFDNEEVGSSTRQGADSALLLDVVRRIAYAMQADEDQIQAALASSFMVSADNAHAVHPNHPEKADAQNRPYMNEGIVIKFNASQLYTSDGVSAAIFAGICEKVGVPVQYFHNRSDVRGGSTLGNISGTHVSIMSVDIGLAQLAMHSSYETAGVKDVAYMIDGLKAFYETDIRYVSDGQIEVN